MTFDPISPRIRAGLVHLGVSAVVAAVASLLVFFVWYPSPFSTLAGGTSLFLILVFVDVVMGPALTLVAARPGKGRGELTRDLAIIVALQLVAFVYGMYTMALARPVALVYEVDRLRVIIAADLEPSSLADAPKEFQSLSWTGPQTLAVIKPTEIAELMKSVELGLAGVPLAALPKYWRSYESLADEAWRRSLPMAPLVARHPAISGQLGRIAANAAVPLAALQYLPVQGRHGVAVAVMVQSQAQILGFLPVDGDL
jgi:hypothetical protein